MSDTTTHLLLPWILAAQAQKHVTHNEALRILDGLVQLSIRGAARIEPPPDPNDGDRFLVAAGATGDWSGWDNSIAYWVDGAWMQLFPQPGWRAWVEEFDGSANSPGESLPGERLLLVYDGASWVGTTPAALQNLDLLGISAAADTTNRLAVSAPAVLLSHEGAGHQLKINKAAAGDTASVLFQNGFSGRAEMGTAGADDFSFKVSADGEAWNTALTIPAATGTPDLKAGATIDGSPAFARANILGSVAQSGGVPTGGVIERGSNANGSYVRFADGTQICWNTNFAVTANAEAIVQGTWTYPAAFSASPAVSFNIGLVNADWSGLARNQVSSWGPVLTPGTTSTRIAVYPATGVGTVTGTISGTMPLALGRWFQGG